MAGVPTTQRCEGHPSEAKQGGLLAKLLGR
jgi:hypothetical protein